LKSKIINHGHYNSSLSRYNKHPRSQCAHSNPNWNTSPKQHTLRNPNQPPFISLPQALNLRTISRPPFLQPNLIFRSGTLSHLPLSSLLILKTKYNITTIFDLRTQAERLKYPSPSIEGVEILWIPGVNDAGGPPKREILREFKEKGVVKVVVPMYRKMLKTHKDVFRGVFGWLREGGLGGGGLLFHCSGS
jgi:hypothetical protein